MVGVNLLAEARSAGLVVKADGDRLVIEGPKRAAAVAQKLIQHKAEVMAALAAGATCSPQPQQPQRKAPPQAPPAKPRRAKRGFQWPAEPQRLDSHFLGLRLRWTEAGGHYRIERFPEDGDPVFIALHADGVGWRVFDHRQGLKAAQTSCRRHFKEKESQKNERTQK